MRVLVCGGRTYLDRNRLFRELWTFHGEEGPRTEVISGMATGADTLAVQWADVAGVGLIPFYAQWHQYGKRAGTIRNEKMLIEGKPDVVIAFAGTQGTAHMKQIARAAGVRVVEISDD